MFFYYYFYNFFLVIYITLDFLLYCYLYVTILENYDIFK